MLWDYWRWFFFGLKDRPGYKGFCDRWLLPHMLIAAFLTLWIKTSLQNDSISVTLPLSGVFIGLSFSWAGVFHAALISPEGQALVKKHPDGLKNYLYKYQTSILVTLVTLILWALYGIGAFQICDGHLKLVKNAIRFILFFLSSLTVRESWHVVLGNQILALTRYNADNPEQN